MFSVAYFLIANRTIQRAQLSVDEVFVLWMVRDVPAHQVSHAISQGLEWLPPTYYLFLKCVGKVLGVTPAALRWPSVVAYYLAILAIFSLLKKRVGNMVAAFCAAFPCLTEVGTVATVARPYAIMVACFALCALLWVDMDTERPSLWRCTGMACLLTLAICVHFNSVFFVVAFGLMELARAVRTRVVRWPCWAAFMAAGASIFLFWPVIKATRQTTLAATSSSGFYAKPSLESFHAIMGMLLIPIPVQTLIWCFLWAIAGIVLLSVCWKNFDPHERWTGEQVEMSSDINLVAMGALLFPWIMFFAALFVTHVFNGRYTYVLIVGVCLLAAQCIRRMPLANWVCLALTVITIHLYRASIPPRNFQDVRMSLLRSATKDIPILTSEASEFFVLYEVSGAPQRERLVYSQMPDGVPNNDFDPERIAIAWKSYHALPVTTAKAFFAANRDFYLLYPSSDRERMGSWIMDRSHVTYVDHRGPYYLFEVSDVDPNKH